MAKYRALRQWSYEPREPEHRGRWRAFGIGDVFSYPSTSIPTVLDIDRLLSDGVVELVI